MGYLKSLYKFTSKLNKKEEPYTITDELLVLSDGKWEGFLAHDNVLEKTIEIYTHPNKQGSKNLNYTIGTKNEQWKTYLKVFGAGEKLYLCYETFGDTVEAEDINKLQSAMDYLDTNLELTKQDLVDHKADNVKHITAAERSDWNSKAYQRDLDLTNASLSGHSNNVANPHDTTKEQVGLSNVDNVQQATKVEFNSHKVDNTTHITAIERTLWNDKYTRNEVDNKLATLETNIDWKESVNTYSDIATIYSTPHDGWTVNVKDTDYTYRYTGTEWVAISANTIPKATTNVDGLISKEDKANLDDANTKKHTHDNKTVLDGIIQVAVDKWNAAHSHIADTARHITGVERSDWNSKAYQRDLEVTNASLNRHSSSVTNPHNTTKEQVGLSNVDNVQQATKEEFNSHNTDAMKHITAVERTLWNTVQNKVDTVLGKGLSTEDYTKAEKTKLNGIATGANNYSLPIASATVVGGIKVGSGLAVTSGVLSAIGGGVADSVDWANVKNKPSIYPTNIANIADLNNGFTGKSPGNDNGNIPLNNGSTNVNLNADMLDGKHATDFASSNHIHVGLNGRYTGNGGFQAPSYFSKGQTQINMMNKIPGTSQGYCDVVLIDGYNGIDIPQQPTLILEKSIPRMYIANQHYDATTWGTPYKLYSTYDKPTPDEIGALHKKGLTWNDLKGV
ncbi:MAG: hypothetical protein AB9856_21135 [Cellulosilyticaceae bacterium]